MSSITSCSVMDIDMDNQNFFSSLLSTDPIAEADAAQLVLSRLQKICVEGHAVLLIESGSLRVAGTTHMVKNWASSSTEKAEGIVLLRQADTAQDKAKLTNASRSPSIPISMFISARTDTESCGG